MGAHDCDSLLALSLQHSKRSLPGTKYVLLVIVSLPFAQSGGESKTLATILFGGGHVAYLGDDFTAKLTRSCFYQEVCCWKER